MPCKISQFFRKIVLGTKGLVKELVPVVIGFVQALKVADDISGDAIAGVIGGIAPSIQEKLKTLLPKLLFDLRMVETLMEAYTPEQVNAAIATLINQIQFSDDIKKQQLLTNMAAMILQQLTDGKLSFAEAVIDIEYYYQHSK